MSNRIFFLPVLLVSFLLSAGLAQAETVRMLPARDGNFNYTWLQGGFEFGRIETPRADVSSIFAEGSWALDEHLFLLGGMRFFDGDMHSPGFSGSGPDVDGHRLQAGMGFNTRLDDGLDLVLAAQVIRVHASVEDHGSGSEHGFDLRGGVRYQASEQVELAGGAFLEDVARSELGFYGEGLYHLRPQLDLGVRLALGDDVSTVGLFARFGF